MGERGEEGGGRYGDEEELVRIWRGGEDGDGGGGGEGGGECKEGSGEI